VYCYRLAVTGIVCGYIYKRLQPPVMVHRLDRYNPYLGFELELHHTSLTGSNGSFIDCSYQFGVVYLDIGFALLREKAFQVNIRLFATGSYQGNVGAPECYMAVAPVYLCFIEAIERIGNLRTDK